jgi:hypothetical protein
VLGAITATSPGTIAGLAPPVPAAGLGGGASGQLGSADLAPLSQPPDLPAPAPLPPPQAPPLSMSMPPPLREPPIVGPVQPLHGLPPLAHPSVAAQPPPQAPRVVSYPYGGYASGPATRPLAEIVAEEFVAAGPDGKVDLKALGRRAADIAEREAIIAMLARTGGSKREAADRLGISYKAILYKIREFEIGKPRTPRAKPPATPSAEPDEIVVDVDP